MLRRSALLTILTLAGIAVAACGGGSTSPSTTPSPSLSAAPGTATPVPSTTVWQISGQLAGTPSMSVAFCAPTKGYYDVLLAGEINGEQLNISFFSPRTGTLDYASAASATTIYAALAPAGSQATSLWQATAGTRGAQGTVVLGADASGSMSGIVVPPSIAGPGDATANITLNGEWKCTSSIPSP
jgi:hypothetical protein